MSFSANASVDLVPVADVQAWMTALSITATGSDQLQLMVSAMSDAIARWLGYSPIQQDYHVEFDGKGQPRVAFPQTPVTAISSLSIDGVTIPRSDGPMSWGYVLSTSQRQSWLSLRGGRFNRGTMNCAVSYTAGYTQANMPPALLQACMESITALSQITGREPGLTKEKVGGLEEDYAAPSTGTTVLNGFFLTPTITLALAPLRRIVPAW